MYKSRIFGTPPEPVFNMKSACLPPDLLEEALYVLAAENEKSMNDANGMQGFFKGGRPAGNLKYKRVFCCKWAKQVYYALISCFFFCFFFRICFSLVWRNGPASTNTLSGTWNFWQASENLLQSRLKDIFLKNVTLPQFLACRKLFDNQFFP